MDDIGQRENGRHKHDQYKSLHSQWMVPPHLMKDHHAMTMKFMSILSERDAAIAERNLALSEKKAAIAERDIAILQRDAAIADRNTALLERDNAVAALGYHHPFPISTKPRRAKRPKDMSKKSTKMAKKGKREDLNKQLSLVAVEEGVVPVPGCSCTGVMQQCYKWGKGGWQSACCTTTLSMYPLPVMPNKRHARLGGRKMSGSAFGKLVNRLAGEGHDMSVAIDLKEHWAKHGTNRYITIK